MFKGGINLKLYKKIKEMLPEDCNVLELIACVALVLIIIWLLSIIIPADINAKNSRYGN